MTCDRALERMLEAEPAALRGAGDSELAAHVVRCERCARAAAALLDELETLDVALGDVRGRRTADTAADAALATMRHEARDDRAPARPDGESHARGGRPGWRTWTRGAWVPLAAAAALAAVLLVRGDRPVMDPVPEGPALEPRVSVTPPADRSAAIMETANPDITIIWLYERGGS